MHRSVRQFSALIAFSSLCFAFAADVSPTAPSASVSDAQLDAFMTQWKTSKGRRAGNEDMPLLLASLRKDPNGPWSSYITRQAAAAHTQARSAVGMERTNLFAQTLTYLIPARNILSDAFIRQPKLEYHYGHVLDLVATAALEIGGRGRLAEAKGAAQEMLSITTDGGAWYYGNVIYDANAMLGRVALREGNTDAAKNYLLAAGNTKGSPQLNSFGPRFTLARELAEKGESDTVIEFLDLVAFFWGKPPGSKDSQIPQTANKKQLDSWKQEIRDGKIPTAPSWR